jgi:hypothetical protein
MKTFYLLACLLAGVLFCQTAHAQSKIVYSYDANGNRDSRGILTLRKATIDSDSLQAKQEIQPLEDKVGLQETRIYPNPTRGMLRIDFPELTGQQPEIRVYDPSGRQIVQKTALSSGNEIDLSSHPSGFYIMVIQIGQEKKDWKIIKE